MKIIKNNWTAPLETTCAECRSIISIESDDIRRSEDHDLMGYTRIRRFVICPVCKATLDFKFPSDDENKSEVQHEDS